MPISALPTPPSRQDPTNFNDRADAFLGALPLFQSEANTLQTDVNSKQTQSATSETNAAASALAAAQTAGASIWVSGTTYAVGDNRFSPSNFKTYRRKTAGAGTTDPSLDGTNWQLLTTLGDVSTVGDQTIAGVKTFSSVIEGEIKSTWRGAGTASASLANGGQALRDNTTGTYNTALGFLSLWQNTTGSNNTVVGAWSVWGVSNSNRVTAVGSEVAPGAASDSTAIGYKSMFQTYGINNTALGSLSLSAGDTATNNTAIGTNSLSSLVNLSNCSALGYNTAVTGSNQVQLGNSSTTTYVYGTVQNRSDLRDKVDVRDTVLGLNFINSLRPVDYKWDLRDDYKPEPPTIIEGDATEEEKAQHKILVQQWAEACKAENITRDGSKKRNRYHHGLIAQEVKAVIDQQGIDFGGYQDHKLAGGQDVLSIGYDELVAPLIKAVQELTKKVQDLEQQIAAK